jgi:tetratricopeptide (TPR) repeat protein
MNSEATLSDALSEVDTALAASDNERAAGLASELLLAYPNAVNVLRQRARALTAAGRSLQAAEVHRRVLEILPADGEAIAGLARTLHAAGQHAEARDAARQALDYFPIDDLMQRIAANEGLPFQPEPTSLHLYKARVHVQAGLNNRGAAGLRGVMAKWPERADIKIAFMQALWRKGARIAAAEQAQAVLDEYPYCLNAHLLMLALWRDAGASDMERVHLQAINQVDPDHRATRAMLGTQSPLPVQDVPARPAQSTEPATADEDPLAREAWVDSLMAESSALPKPLEQPFIADDSAADAATDSTVAHAEAEIAEPSEFVSSLLPLEWSAANDLSEEPAQDDFGVSWIDGHVKDEFAPARPRAAQPDPNDGVPAELPALEWESEGDESAPQKDHSTAVDGGVAKQEATPAATSNAEPRNTPLKPLAAAGVVAAAVQRDEEKLASAQTEIEPTAPLAEAQAAPADSTPQQAQSQPEAAQVVQAEVEAAAVKPMPLEAVAFADEDTTRWGVDAAPRDDVGDDAGPTQPAPATEAVVRAQEMPVSQEETAPASEAAAPTLPAAVIAEPSPAREGEEKQPAGEQDGSILKAVAVASAMSAAVKRRKIKAAAEVIAPVSEEPPATPATEPAPSETPQAEIPPEAIAPAKEKRKAKKESAHKAAKPKPAAKPTTLETQTEKVRKTYERAIATAKREDMPRLIKELNQAAERDPDNKLIFELLGQAYNRSGDIPAAINAYRRALELADHS